MLLKSIAAHLPFLSRDFCKSMPPLLAESSVYTTKLYHDKAPICIANTFAEALGSGVVGTLPGLLREILENLLEIFSVKRFLVVIMRNESRSEGIQVGRKERRKERREEGGKEG